MFANADDLKTHQRLVHYLETIEDAGIRKRFKLIQPFLEKGLVSKSEIIEATIKTEIFKFTIYKWMLVYKKKGIKGLAPKKRKIGKRSVRFSDQVYQILEDNVRKFAKP